MRPRLLLSFGLVFGLFAALALTTGAALAHERRDVAAATYQFVVGWIVEPAFEGQKNGLDLRVTDKAVNRPVPGLDKTLQVEMTHVPTNITKTLAIRAIFNDPGHYTNDLLVTAPGQYRFRIFGKVEAADVNETFVSSPTTFNGVEPVANIQFPVSLPAARELDSATRGAVTAAQGAQTTATQAQDDAASASTMAMVGIILGAVGLAVGAGGAFMAMRKK